MLFNSLDFALFLPIVFLLYWFLTPNNLKLQNFLLLAASYVFYGWWDWRFLGLLAFTSLTDYAVGRLLAAESVPWKRKVLLSVSITTNLGLLAFFKYYDFFLQSFADAFSLFGRPVDVTLLNIILPIGISFYTFQTLAYTIDVYRKEIQPTRDPVAFLAFVSFFPQLVAGPIERASSLLAQFKQERVFRYASAADGLRQMLWGFFKKIVIADGCAAHVNAIFSNYPDHSGSTLLVGALLFAFQIYGDFSGYSDIAIGTARLFGFHLRRNFAFPYFSRDIAEFWRRWHISLMTWLRDYVYVPLGGGRTKLTRWLTVRNTAILFLVSGLWHGANWTFVAWGALNALYFLPLLLRKRTGAHLGTAAEHTVLPGVKESFLMAGTFALTVVAWIFFRSPTVTDALRFIGRLFSASLFSLPTILPGRLLLMIGVLLIAEWVQRRKQHALQFDGASPPAAVRWGIYYALILAIVWWGGEPQAFIYFQF